MKKTWIASTAVLLLVIAILSVLLLDAKAAVKQLRAHPVQTSPPTPELEASVATPPAQAQAKDISVVPLYPFGDPLPGPLRQGFCGEVLAKDTHALRQDNVIDSTFSPYWAIIPSNLEEVAMTAQYANCWKAEAVHALALLQERAAPHFLDRTVSIEEIADAFDTFSSLNSTIYADLLYTHAYHAETELYDGLFGTGSGWPGGHSLSRAAHYRAYTFYLYDLLAALQVEPEFVFDPEEVHKEWGYLLEGTP